MQSAWLPKNAFNCQIFDKDNAVKSMMYVCPSVDTHGSHNPSIRVYELDDTTFEVVDYIQYYFDLSQYTGSVPLQSPPSVVVLHHSGHYHHAFLDLLLHHHHENRR